MNKKKKIYSVLLIIIIAGLLFVPAYCRRNTNNGLEFVNKKQNQPNLVVVTHGWIEKGSNDWPEDTAKAINERTDSNDWLCGYFDWKKGARVINPVDAALYARNIAGAALAEQIVKLNVNFKHIHLIGHSCGAQVISRAAKILCRQSKADIHLTFLDAYVPKSFNPDALGDVNMPPNQTYWADQYYTRDYTLEVTEYNLKHAHNVDITEADQLIKDHKFPYKWYYATITGKFAKWTFMNNKKLITKADDIEYGFARSKEASEKNWQKSLELKMDNKAVVIER